MKYAWAFKVTGAGTVADVADALHEVAAQFNANCDISESTSVIAAQATSQQCTAAAQAVQIDSNLTRI